MQRQFSGQEPQRTSSPMARAPYGTPPLSAQATGNEWAISPQDKAQFDNIYASVDKANRGSITGEQAVAFFSNSRLPEDTSSDLGSRGHQFGGSTQSR
jgi:epidermal growth factor receptor substrate 15